MVCSCGWGTAAQGARRIASICQGVPQCWRFQTPGPFSPELHAHPGVLHSSPNANASIAGNDEDSCDDPDPLDPESWEEGAEAEWRAFLQVGRVCLQRSAHSRLVGAAARAGRGHTVVLGARALEHAQFSGRRSWALGCRASEPHLSLLLPPSPPLAATAPEPHLSLLLPATLTASQASQMSQCKWWDVNNVDAGFPPTHVDLDKD